MPPPSPSPPDALTPVPLDDLGGFRPAGENWRVAGDAWTRWDSTALVVEPGSGVLVNLPGADHGDHLFTGWEHGDLVLELEYLLPKGSNSGLYLQGRYEVQLFDSWGTAHPRYSDAGGIYRRYDPARPPGQTEFEGHAPRSNASRAPGLWQHLRVVFQSPRFDEAGRKTANARFLEVVHNGVKVQENVEVTGPTREAAFGDEQPAGPLMIQGDHGAVAFRHVRYRPFEPVEPVRLADVRYTFYQGEFSGLAQMESLVKWRGWMLEITPQGEMTPLAVGMRSPAGFTLTKAGEVFYAENQGDWIGSGWVTHVERGDFVGNPAGLRWAGEPGSPLALRPEDVPDTGEPMFEVARRVPGLKPPAVWFPHGIMGVSTSGILEDTTGGAFGPFEGQLFVGDQGHSKIMRMALEEVDGVYQGVVFPFREGFQSGVLVTVGTVPGLRFDLASFQVKPGARVELVLANTDDMLHNLVVVRPGTADQVAQEAMMLGLAGAEKGYVPDTGDVLFHTALLQPGASEGIFFTAPTAPGEYPYVCTFPGHAFTMRGTMYVAP